MKTVLVTGGCGCLGSWVIKLLIEKKDKVICLDTSSNINRLKLILDENYLKKISFNNIDIFDFENINKLIKKEKINFIVHLAAFQVPFVKSNPILGSRVNVEGTVVLYECAVKNKNHKIILTTSRNNKKKLLSLLNNYKIPFDDIICNLPPGSRYLINDIKEDIIPTSYSINLIRNYGIQDIELKNDNIQILKILKGNSFSKTILCQNNNYKKNNIFIRKYILKSNENLRHYHKLKRQYYDLQKFNSYILNICPTVFNENDLDYIYYFDLEYLNDYNQINHINENKDLIILNLLKLLNSEIYITKKLNHNSNWINDYFHKKINFENYKKLHPIINDLFNLDIININHKEYIGLKLLKKSFLLKAILPKAPD